MRAHEFITDNTKLILREYKRDITLRQYGKKILDAWKNGADRIIPLAAFTVLKLDDDEDTDENIVNRIISYMEQTDPTSNKIYVPWIAREYAAHNIKRIEDLGSRITPMLETYHQYKNKGWFPAHAKDIMRVNANQLSSLLANLNIPQEKQVDRGNFQEFYSDSKVRVIIPLDQTAACYYGQGTQWCTAATRGTNMFEPYNRQGKLYIIIPKDPEYDGEKYQLHFASSQFMNEQDSPVVLSWLVRSRFPSLDKVFEKYTKEYLDFLPYDKLVEYFSATVDAVIDYVDENIIAHEDQYDITEFVQLIHDIKWAAPATARKINSYISLYQDHYGDSARVVDMNIIFGMVLEEESESNIHVDTLKRWVDNSLVVMSKEFDWQPGKRRFKLVKKVDGYYFGYYLGNG